MPSKTLPVWYPSASINLIKSRAKLLSELRSFFSQRDVLEVETPVLSQAPVSDPYIEPFKLHQSNLYLHTSPEYSMKRLLCAGSGCIYQVARVFRAGEAGGKHNPEFSMLEWYRVGMNDHDLMAEVAELVNQLLLNDENISLLPVVKISYRELFEKKLGINPHEIDENSLAKLAQPYLGGATFELDKDGWLDILMTHAIEPTLVKKQLTFIYDYPASQAALARIMLDDNGVKIARRFELYVGGMELANGYWELTDGQEQQARFERDANNTGRTVDANLIAALNAGMPDCAGGALGLDRLLMLKENQKTISDVLAFDISRA
jgi:lysyl-tRNA synthetase class 2